MERAAPLPADAPISELEPEARFLGLIGRRVREARARRGMTRKILARDCGVSERYLAQLEAGRGNISILLLRQVARALDLPLAALADDRPEPAVAFQHVAEFLHRLSPEQLEEAHGLLTAQFGGAELAGRERRIALIGLRGAGKSTLGARLAAGLGVPFIELDREIERESGLALGVIFDLYGQPGFRRLERECLDKILKHRSEFVLATGGSLVSEPATFERLRTACFTVWLKASPAEHMARVVAQGDMRPMTDNREAMADLQRILSGRAALYGMADAQADTSGCGVEEALERLIATLPPDRKAIGFEGELRREPACAKA